jgi:hypothetical protein
VCEDIEQLAVTFRRPNPEAKIIQQDSGTNAERAYAQIEVSGSRDIDKTYVLIRSTGQISVSKNNICDIVGGGNSNE